MQLPAFILPLAKTCIRFLVFFALFLPAKSQAQAFIFTQRKKRELIPFKMVKNLLIISLQINGKGPFNFVLDTGVGLVLITNPSLIDSLQLQNLRNIKIAGMGPGEDLTAFVVPAIAINLSPTIAGIMPAAILKKDAFDLSGFTGMQIDGLIGYEVFSSFMVKINYLSDYIALYNPNRSVPFRRIRRMNRIPITIEEHKPYLQSVIQLDDGRKINAKLIIDTGAGHPVSLETNDGIPFPVPQKRIEGNLGVGLSGKIDGYVARLPSVKIGKYTFKNVITSFPDYNDVAVKVISVSRNGSIGNNIMKRFEVIFDYGREMLFLKPNANFHEPFEHDMSGLEVASFGEDFSRVLITRVEPGSAGEEAGLLQGDEILAINFIPVSELGLEKIDQTFKSQNGKSLVLTIINKHSDQKKNIIITLRRRI